jgi:hypothetical protein
LNLPTEGWVFHEGTHELVYVTNVRPDDYGHFYLVGDVKSADPHKSVLCHPKKIFPTRYQAVSRAHTDQNVIVCNLAEELRVAKKREDRLAEMCRVEYDKEAAGRTYIAPQLEG